MLSVGWRRAVCCVRAGSCISVSPRKWHRGIKDWTGSAPLEEVVRTRRQQAQRTLLVEVAGASSAAELCRVCGQHGRVQALFHYTLPPRGHVKPREMILIEYSEATEAQEALKYASHAPSKDCPPSHSPMMWLSAGRGTTTPKKSDPTPPVTLTPVITQEEVLQRLSQCSSISDQIQTLHDTQRLTELGWRLRFFTCRQVESSLSGLFPCAVVLPFGSSVNSFGHRDSDLDMTLELAGDGTTQGGSGRLVFQGKHSSTAANPRLTLQRRMEVIAELIDHFLPGCSQVQRILNARVPIIKYKQQLTAIDCDLTMSNRSGYHMSRMLHLYGSSDSRVVPLVGAVRRWARCRGITSPHAGRWITNFSLTMMVLTYLMNTSPPVLLPLTALQVMPGVDEETGEPVFRVPSESATTAAATAARNTESLESLLRGFFEFFDKFNFRERGMSIVTGRNFVKPVHCALYIQNPLDRDLNVSRNVTLEEVERLKTEVTHARYVMEAEAQESDSTGGVSEGLWGAQRLWWRSSSAAQRHIDTVIDWRAVFHSGENSKGKELPNLVSKLKQKAQQRKNQTPRYTRKGKIL
ncbi:poly(A) RNA polymerase, mitochondrial-like [Portunus trituberculatus]|uniref:poly(A) RNA polymerase, mitochondrial-like n=1 Tax=Portunus trituberculatus TaxID=210409 RepID=UPI001E1CB813|nr:poly(A) RNA polymerase, mitochondrial-like [Portunus trituberculatus]XP_045122743.1 poly(A) RNA polymerase, mitochondrial-like [Portunus trituberculatus]